MTHPLLNKWNTSFFSEQEGIHQICHFNQLLYFETLLFAQKYQDVVSCEATAHISLSVITCTQTDPLIFRSVILTVWTCTPTVPWQSPTPDPDPLCCWPQTWWQRWRPACGSELSLRCKTDTCEKKRQAWQFTVYQMLEKYLYLFYGMFEKLQSGFHSFHSTETELISFSAVINDLLLSADFAHYFVAVLLDLSLYLTLLITQV